MVKQVLLWGLGIFAVVAVLGLLAYKPLIQPWHARWGATGAEAAAALPGDEVVSEATLETTRAIDIHAPAEKVWPWILQLGQGRGGLYSYDFLENLVGCNIHTLDHIVPELQNLKVGDIIRMGPQDGLPYYKVLRIDPGKAMVMQSVAPKTGVMGETWGFYLAEQGGGATRLVIRHRGILSVDSTERTVNAIFEPISFVMERKMLFGIRDHAEN